MDAIVPMNPIRPCRRGRLARVRAPRAVGVADCFALLLAFLALYLFGSGCATPDVNPPVPRPNTGYVDLHADGERELSWEVVRIDDSTGAPKRLFRELTPLPGPILRLALAPGACRLRITILNRVIHKPAEIEVRVQEAQITPVQLKFTDAGVVYVRTKEESRGGTPYGRYGRNTTIGTDEALMFDLAAEAGPPIPYQPKERMPYAR